MARAIPLPGGGVRYEPETREEWEQQANDARREAYMNGQPYNPGPMPSRFRTGNTATQQGVPVESRGYTLPGAGEDMGGNPLLNQGGGLRQAQEEPVYDPGTSRDRGNEKPVKPMNTNQGNTGSTSGGMGGLPLGGDSGWGTGRYTGGKDLSQLSAMTPAMLQYELAMQGLNLKADELEKLGLGELILKGKALEEQTKIQNKTLEQNKDQFGSTLDFQRFKDLRDRALAEQQLNAQTGLGATGQMQQEEQAKISAAIQAANAGDNTQLQRLGLSQQAAQAIMAGKSDAERINIANQQMSQAGLLGKANIELQRAQLGIGASGQADAAKLNRQKTALDASGMLANSAMDRAKLMASLGGPENAFRQMQALRGLDRSGNLQLSAILRGEAPAASFQAPQAGSNAQSMDTIANQLAQNGSGDARAKNPFGTMAEIAAGNASGNSVDNSRLSTEGGNFMADQTGATGNQIGQQATGFGQKDYQADTGAMEGIQDYAGGLGREENANQKFGEQIKDTIGNSATNDILTGIAAPNTAAGTFGNASTAVDRDNSAQQISTAYNERMKDPAFANLTGEERRVAVASLYKDMVPGMTQAQAEQLSDQVKNYSAASGGGPPDITQMNNMIKASLGNQALKGTRTNMGAGTRVTDAMNTYDQRNPRPQLAPWNPAIETEQDFKNRQGGHAGQVADYENQRNQTAQNLWRNEGLTPEQAGQAHAAAKTSYLNSGVGSPMNHAAIGGVVNDANNGRPIRPGTFGGYPNRPAAGSFGAEGGEAPMWNRAQQQPQLTMRANPGPGMGPQVQSNVPMQVSTPQPPGRTLGAAPQPQPYRAPAASPPTTPGGWGQDALNTPKPQPAMAAAPKPGGANPGNPDFTGVKPDPNAKSWEDKQATAFQSGLPAANQLNARNFGRLNDSEKKFTLAGYEAAGQSKDDVMDTIQKTLPKATGPKFGRVA